ncbi:Calx-beta domain-containing protein [Tepidiforma sp.]|uniref:Calx-beta domain-containing protein n=1 Tax=Tepidiforma sp. TaxID=2682230 RepID=UPI002ADD95CA|nr:Calx-beta domain-containing protein [Tepidiforma sp.]
MGRVSDTGYFVRRSLLFVLVVLLAGALGTRLTVADGATNGSFSFATTAGVALPSGSVVEGQAACINIHRSGGSQGTQQVQVALTSGNPADVSGFGSMYVTFLPGVLDRTIDPGVYGGCLATADDSTTGDKTVVFTIQSVTGGGVVGSPNAFTLTILDNDGPPKYSFQTAATSVTEGNSGSQVVGVAVVRVGSTAGTDSVICQLGSGSTATGSGTDYSFSNQTITFNPGDSGPKNCTVTVVGDTVTESNETIVLALVGASGFGGGAGTTTQHTVTIVDDDGTGTVQFSQATYSVSEGVGTATIGVTRTGGSTGAASVACSTVAGGSATAGADYTTVTNQTLSWANGDSTTKFCTIPILQDTLIEGPETVNLQLSGVTGATLGSQSTATLTITDDDGTGSIQFSSATFVGTEAGGPITITVTRTGGSVGAVTVDFASVTGGTATAGVDYTSVSGTLSWANGETGSKSFTVTPIPDTLTEGSETVVLQLSNPTGGAVLGTPNQATLTISDSTIIPVITSISPGAGPVGGGTTVTISGQNFTGATSVTFDGIPCTSLTVVSATVITCVTPPHAAGVVEVIVTTPIGSNVTTGSANDFVYTTGPTVASLSPSQGACNGITTVQITGTGFTSSGTSVVFGAVSATFAYVSPTQLVAVAPSQGAGVVDVRVTTPGGTSPNTVADDFTCTGTPVPTVTGVSPTSGPVGTTVTITGTNFTGATSVTFGGVAASFTVVSGTQITATVPAGVSPGVVDVRVTNAGGTSANTAADNFTVTSTGTIRYSLYRTFTLIVWTGADNKPIRDAIGGTQQGTTNIGSLVGAIWLFDAPSQTWGGYFPGTDDDPRVNDFTTFRAGVAYFIALRPTAPSVVTWDAPAN